MYLQGNMALEKHTESEKNTKSKGAYIVPVQISNRSKSFSTGVYRNSEIFQTKSEKSMLQNVTEIYKVSLYCPSANLNLFQLELSDKYMSHNQRIIQRYIA